MNEQEVSYTHPPEYFRPAAAQEEFTPRFSPEEVELRDLIFDDSLQSPALRLTAKKVATLIFQDSYRDVLCARLGLRITRIEKKPTSEGPYLDLIEYFNTYDDSVTNLEVDVAPPCTYKAIQDEAEQHWGPVSSTTISNISKKAVRSILQIYQENSTA